VANEDQTAFLGFFFRFVFPIHLLFFCLRPSFFAPSLVPLPVYRYFDPLRALFGSTGRSSPSPRFVFGSCFFTTSLIFFLSFLPYPVSPHKRFLRKTRMRPGSAVVFLYVSLFHFFFSVPPEVFFCAYVLRVFSPRTCERPPFWGKQGRFLIPSHSPFLLFPFSGPFFNFIPEPRSCDSPFLSGRLFLDYALCALCCHLTRREGLSFFFSIFLFFFFCTS